MQKVLKLVKPKVLALKPKVKKQAIKDREESEEDRCTEELC